MSIRQTAVALGPEFRDYCQNNASETLQVLECGQSRHLRGDISVADWLAELSQSDVELMTEEEVLGLKPAPRLEVG